MSPLSVAVITPSFNQGPYIEETICSVLAQDYSPLEYWVIDGGSSDATLAILHRYQQRLHWISEKDQGQADAVNKGLARTQAEVIGWLNSDDIYYPHALARVTQFFQENPEIDIVYGQAEQIDAHGNKLEPYVTEKFDLERLKLRCFISQPAVFFRRRVIEHYGGLNPQLHFCLDYEYWLRLGLHGAKFAYLPQVLAAARIYADTKSSRGYREAHLEAIEMLQQSLGSVPAQWLVHYSTAVVKTEKALYFPQLGFLFHAWLNLWRAVGLHQQGWARLKAWLAIHRLIIKKFWVKLQQCL